MSHVMGVPVSEVVKESIGLAFVTYPQAISLIPNFAQVFGVLFFSVLVVAGLSSAVSLVEAFSSAIIDKFHYSRKVVVSVVCTTGFLGSVVFTARSGLYWIDIVDHFITHYGLVVIGLLECLLVGWVLKSKKLREHINHAAGTTLSAFWDICIKFITPAVLVTLLINDICKEVSAPYEGYPWVAIILLGRDWILIALIAALFISIKGWRRDLKATESV